MSKNCVITLEDELVERASENAHKLGKSLKQVIEDAITTTADTETEGPWITEKGLETLDWAPSRVTLWQMRKDGLLEPGKHYKRHGRFLYYNKSELRKVLMPEAAVKNGSAQAEAAT